MANLRRFLQVGALAALGLATLGLSQSRASITVALVGGPTPVAGGFDYDYSLSWSAGDVLTSGDFFTIYDFAGLVSGSETVPLGSGFTFTEQNVGITPPAETSVVDDPLIPNITFTYSGPPLPPSQSPLLSFSATSTFGTVNASGAFTGSIQNDTLPQKNQSIGPLTVPATSGVPEPSTMVLAGLGGAALLLFRRRKATA